MNESIIKTQITDENIQIISLNGSIVYEHVQDYKKIVKDSIKDAEGYILDLRMVTKMDSTGLGLLVNIAKYFIQNHNKMVILNNDDLINELFKISKLDKLFEICDTKSESIKSIKDNDESYWSRVMQF